MLVTEYLEQINTKQRPFNQLIDKTQHKLIGLSLLYAGIGFLITCGLSLLIAWLIRKNEYIIYSNNYLYISLGISIVSMVVGSLIYSLWSKNIFNASPGIIVFNYILNILIYTAMLAPLIALIDDYWVILLSISIIGITLFICGIIGYTMINNKVAISISKILGICTSVLIFIQLIFCFAFMFSYSGMQLWMYIFIPVLGLISIGYLILCFYTIAKFNNFTNGMESNTINKLGLYFGFNIMCILLKLFSLILMIFYMFGKSNR